MSFSGPVKTQWNDDGVNMTVIETISYTDPQGRIWYAEEGLVTDGATIPQELWSLFGSPFTGAYRVAAVFHDAAYSDPGVLKADADHMLYQAMLELKCPLWQADAIYSGVKDFASLAFTRNQVSAAETIAGIAK